jgi:enediyne biosynthesis protein E4
VRWHGLVVPLACAIEASAHAQQRAELPSFRDVTADSGLTVAYDNGARGRLELLAIMGPGAALFDYDGDGDLDLFLPQGGMLPSDRAVGAGRAPSGGGRLLRNDLVPLADGKLAARFVDVTARSGLATHGYGVAAAVGDYDNDGAPDLFVGNIGADELWRNRGDGTFEEAAPPALAKPGWTSGASFTDLDGDGDLDLYVVEYVDPVADVHCFAESSRPDYCGPAAYRALPDRLLRNDGGSPTTWTDVSSAAGITAPPGPGLGVVASDADGDGRADLFVANDGQPNFLWRNQGGLRFADEGLLAGVALSREGLARAGMGVDAADVDGDGDEDLFVTNLSGEGDTLYVNLGDALFEDRTAESGLAAPSRPWTGFGTAFLDADLDGWLDLVAVNGAVRLVHGSAAAAGGARPETQLAQPAQLYHNLGGGRFALAPTAEAGDALAVSRVARGLALGDVDEDGDTDLLIATNDAPPTMLLGEAPAAAGWVGVAPCPGVADAPWLARTVAATSGLGGRAATSPLVRRPHRDGSYASARDPRVVAGLGGAGTIESVELRRRRSDGAAERVQWRQPPLHSYLVWCSTP